MFTKYAERYVLRSCSEGGYLSINAVNQGIESQPSLDKAWIFHSHDGAVNHAPFDRQSARGNTGRGEAGQLTGPVN